MSFYGLQSICASIWHQLVGFAEHGHQVCHLFHGPVLRSQHHVPSRTIRLRAKICPFGRTSGILFIVFVYFPLFCRSFPVDLLACLIKELPMKLLIANINPHCYHKGTYSRQSVILILKIPNITNIVSCWGRSLNHRSLLHNSAFITLSSQHPKVFSGTGLLLSVLQRESSVQKKEL